MTPPSTQQKKKRNRGPNTTSGCQTCKIRRKACDSTKPACLRCSSTGRTCDFLSSLRATPLLHESKHQDHISRSHPWPRSISSAPSLLRFGDSAEGQHFDFFRVECTKEFSESFNAPLWQQLILQAAYNEPFILHAVLAISSLRRSQLSSVSMSDKYILKRYTVALQTFRNRIQDNALDWTLVALASLVFLAYEVLQGNEQEAMTHFRGGYSLLNVPRPRTEIPHQKVPDCHGIISDDIVTAFTRLSVGEDLFFGVSTTNSTTFPIFPSSFESVIEARTSLNSVMAAMFSFMQQHNKNSLKTLPHTPTPESISQEYSRAQKSLQDWYFSFNQLQSKLTTEETAIKTNILLVQYIVTSIKLSTFFHNTELIYDSYLSSFSSILSLTSTIITAQASHPDLKGPCFTLDIAMAQPLFFVARKCRDLDLRRRAIDEMKRIGNKGGVVYTGRTVAKVAEWIVGVEMEDCGARGFVREEKRLRDVSFEIEYGTRRGDVRASRKGRDGVVESLQVELDLS